MPIAIHEVDGQLSNDETWLELVRKFDIEPIKQIEISDGKFPKKTLWVFTIYRGNGRHAVLEVRPHRSVRLYISGRFQEVDRKFYQLVSDQIEGDA